MTETTATDEAQIPEGSAAPEAASPAEGTSSATSPSLASPETDTPASGDNETGTPPAKADATPERKSKPDRVKELLAERNFWREQAMRGNPAQPPAQEQPAAPEGPPTLEQHGFDTEAWSKAYAAYYETRAGQLVEQHLAKKEQERAAQAVQQQFAEREASFAAATPDYADVMSDPELGELTTPAISECVVTSEYGPQIGFHLATHRDELQAIRKMTPVQQARALGRLEARFSGSATPPAAPAKPKAVQQTRAPAPPSPVGSANASDVDTMKLSADEWGKRRNAEVAARRR